MDELADDVPDARCLALHLPQLTPITITDVKEDADLIFKVPGAAARAGLGVMGGRPSGHLDAQLPDGKSIWDDGAKVGSGWSNKGVPTAGSAGQISACEVTDELIDTLRNAMRNARGK